MLKFIGENCPVCSEEFKEGDDIVVCPICGTPHHRECYNKDNKCANESYHADKKVWEPTKNNNSNNGLQQVVCQNCKTINSANTKNCVVCGKELQPQNPNPQTINDEKLKFVTLNDVKINGLSLQNFHIYLRLNQKYYISKFKQHENDNFFLSFNWAACIFSFIYYFYRKMYAMGIAVLSLILLSLVPVFTLSLKVMPQIMEYMQEIVINPSIISTLTLDFTGYEKLLTLANFCARLPFVISIAGAMIANYIYRNKAIKDITNILKQDMPVKDTNLKLYFKGGVSVANAVSVLLFIFVAYFIFVNVVSMNFI